MSAFVLEGEVVYTPILPIRVFGRPVGNVPVARPRT